MYLSNKDLYGPMIRYLLHWRSMKAQTSLCIHILVCLHFSHTQRMEVEYDIDQNIEISSARACQVFEDLAHVR